MPEEPPGTVKPCDLWPATPHIQSVMHDKHPPGSQFIHFLHEESGGGGGWWVVEGGWVVGGGVLKMEGKKDRGERVGDASPHLHSARLANQPGGD